MNSLIDFNLILITDSAVNNSLYRIVDEACDAGVKAVMVRDKISSAGDMLALSKGLRKITAKYSSKLIINDRYDIALLLGADGLHSPEGGLKPAQLKTGRKFFMGKSVHSLQASKQAEKDGFDYIIFGPVYRTPSKAKYGKTQGLKNLRDVCTSVSIPVFAVGGINPERASKCINAGAYGAAVVRDIILSDNVKKTVKDYFRII